MNNLIPNATPKEVQRNPMGYILLVMAGLLGWFGSFTLNKDAQERDSLRQTIIEERKKNEILQTRVDFLTNIFIKNDSTSRAILDKPVRDLLNQVKK